MKRYIIISLCFLFHLACKSKSQNDPVQVCDPPTKYALSMEKASFQVRDSGRVNDSRFTTLKLGTFNSSAFPSTQPIADSALHIASVLLSSADFKSAINRLDFGCNNFGSYCRKECNKCNDRFKGSVVLDKLFSQKEVSLDLYLRDCGNEYGHAARNIKEIYSCQRVVFFDTKELSPAYCYGYHIAHEYMHVLGFFHTDYKDDVAHQTGWIGYYILLDWKQKGIEAMTLKPGDL